MDLFTSDKFAQRVEDLLQDWHTPGISIAIIQNGQTESRAFGKACLDPEVPMTPDTLLDIASSSKSITAAAVALLVADNERYPQVQWDAKISSLLPDDFVMSGRGYTEDVTVEDILSHRTGLPSHDSSYVGIKASIGDTPKSITRNLRNLGVAAPIRSSYMYCNLMFTVATHLVEQTAGMPFADFVRQNLFVPMGMSSTHILPSAAVQAGLKERMAFQYCWSDGTFVFTPWEETPEAIGAGSIFTSANDYLKYIRHMIDRTDPVSEDMYKELIRPRTLASTDNEDVEPDPLTSFFLYALGWEVRWYRGHKIVSHDGSVTGIGSNHFFVPRIKFGGVVLANADDGTNIIDVLSRELLDEALNVPQEERPDWNALVHRRIENMRKSQVKGDAFKKKIWPEFDGGCQPQKLPLPTYVGEYWNAGYKGMTVEIKDKSLFIDAFDRSFPLTISFEHVCNQTMYVAHLRMPPLFSRHDEEELEAEFRFANDKVVGMGIKLEDDLSDYIWFHKVVNT